ncbi:hypothetical protein CHISP_2703 [Chitinispirillum alkaliphilum]|nr:hypothetical protein CHISP_2703 [Chitinispirillum alkaliphilum]
MKRSLFLASALMFTFTIRTEGHFRPDTSLVVTTINEFLANEHWSIIDREIIGYDDERRKLFRSFESIGLEHDIRTLWNYDEDGIRAEKVYLEEDFNFSWRVVQRDSIYSHPQSDTILSQYVIDDQLVNYGREIINYDEAGRVTEEIRYTMTEEEWIAHVRHTYEYDAQGNMIEHLTQQRQLGDEQLVNLRREINTYENGKIITSFAYSWSREREDWVRSLESHYRYYTVNKKSVAEELTLNVIGEQRENFRRIFDTTDVSGLTTGWLRQVWDDDMWVNDLRSDYSYDFMGNVIMISRQRFIDGAWVSGERTRYEYAYYLDDTSNRLVSQKPRNNLSVTETRNEISFTGLNDAGSVIMFRVYDLQGRLVFSKNIETANQHTIRIRNNWAGASGMRLLQLSTREKGVIYQRRIGVGLH